MPSIRCGKCGATHASVAEVANCYQVNAYAGAGENHQPTADQTELDFTIEIQRLEREEEERRLAWKFSREALTAPPAANTSSVFASVRNQKQQPSPKQAKFLDALVADREGAAELLARNGYFHGIIDEMIKLPLKATDSTIPAIAAGRYAVRGADNTIDFYKVDKPEKGKWAGYTFVKQLIGSVGDWSERYLNKGQSAAILAKIGLNPEESARLFGQTAKACGNCLSPLSDPQSRAAGYGEHCASKHGYWYPTRKEALELLGEEETS